MPLESFEAEMRRATGPGAPSPLPRQYQGALKGCAGNVTVARKGSIRWVLKPDFETRIAVWRKSSPDETMKRLARGEVKASGLREANGFFSVLDRSKARLVVRRGRIKIVD
jgi:hypothetical protein